MTPTKIYLYISFFSTIFKKKNFSKKNSLTKNNSWEIPLIHLLNLYQLNSYKKIIIFKNLKIKNNLFYAYSTQFSYYKKELYFSFGLLLYICFAKYTRNEHLFGKFIYKYIKMYHRRKRHFNKFYYFLQFFSNFLLKSNLISGIKIQIKGRIKGRPRSKNLVFQKGNVPLQTRNSYISYTCLHIPTTYGVFGLKIWIHQIPIIQLNNNIKICKLNTFKSVLNSLKKKNVTT